MIRRLLVASLLVAASFPAAARQVLSKQFLSPVYTIDRKYRSMEGPGSLQKYFLGDPSSEPELLWIVGVRTEMVGEDGRTPQLPELMCHVNVDLDAEQHRALFDLKRTVASRLITLSQGIISARLPDGFGFPVASNEPLLVFTQVLNHNIEKPKNLKVRHRVTFEFVRDRDLETPINPLFNVGASGMVILQDNPLALPGMGGGHVVDATGGPGGEGHGTSCLLLPRAPNAGMSADYVDPSGRKMTGHWVVPPGRQVNASDITWFMALPYDTTLHYAAAHLHPYAQSLSVRDVTTGETVFEVKAEGPKKGVGLTKVDTFVSEKGVPLRKDHKYELVSVYDNPTKENADSMASAFLGLADREFVKPDRATLAARAIEYLDKASDPLAVVRTSIGDFGVALMLDTAPATARQFLRMARSGVWTRARLVRSDAAAIEARPGGPLTAVQRAVIRPLLAERGVPHEAGTLSLCPGDASLTIVVGRAVSRDGQCTAFARVGPGSAVIRQLAEGMPLGIEITRIDVYDRNDAASITLAPVKTASR